jgi:hypothetical protein
MIVTFDTSILVRATKRSDKIINALALNPDHVIALPPFILGEVGKSQDAGLVQAVGK